MRFAKGSITPLSIHELEQFIYKNQETIINLVHQNYSQNYIYKKIQFPASISTFNLICRRKEATLGIQKIRQSIKEITEQNIVNLLKSKTTIQKISETCKISTRNIYDLIEKYGLNNYRKIPKKKNRIMPPKPQQPVPNHHHHNDDIKIDDYPPEFTTYVYHQKIARLPHPTQCKNIFIKDISKNHLDRYCPNKREMIFGKDFYCKSCFIKTHQLNDVKKQLIKKHIATIGTL